MKGDASRVAMRRNPSVAAASLGLTPPQRKRLQGLELRRPSRSRSTLAGARISGRLAARGGGVKSTLRGARAMGAIGDCDARDGIGCKGMRSKEGIGREGTGSERGESGDNGRDGSGPDISGRGREGTASGRCGGGRSGRV
jgi:hypothetical protein